MVIDQPEVVKATLEIVTTETCRIAPIVRLTAVGGTGPYYYSADGITYSTVSFNSFVDITLPVTTTKVQYKYFVKTLRIVRAIYLIHLSSHQFLI